MISQDDCRRVLRRWQAQHSTTIDLFDTTTGNNSWSGEGKTGNILYAGSFQQGGTRSKVSCGLEQPDSGGRVVCSFLLHRSPHVFGPLSSQPSNICSLSMHAKSSRSPAEDCNRLEVVEIVAGNCDIAMEGA
jgi:hypothetical protein